MSALREEVLSSTEETSNATDKTDEECKEVKLLFFGTFYHDSSTEYNADLVQFKETTRVTEIRVIPLGATVTLPSGSFQLGATNPSDFELEVYYNDLQVPTKSTFELLSFFNFNDKSRIQLLCDPELEIITDGILVRGLYSTVTLAMYGHGAKVVIKEPVKEEIVVPNEEKIVEKLPIVIENSKTNSDVLEFERRVEDGQKSILIDVREAMSESRVTSFIPPVDISDIPQAIPTINTRVSFDPIMRNLPPEEEEPFEEEMLEIPVVASDADLSSDEHFDGVSTSPVIDSTLSTRYKHSRTCPDVEYSRRRPSPVGADEELMEVEDISDGEVPSSLENDDSCPDFPAIVRPSSLSPVTGDKHDLPASPARVSEKQRRDSDGKMIPGVDIVSPPHELSDQDDSLIDEFHEPGFEEIISDEEVPDFNEAEYFQWQDFTPSLLSKPFNHLSESFQVTPLITRTTEDSLMIWKKSPEDSWDQLLSATEKYSPANFDGSIMENWVEMLESVTQHLPAALSVRHKKAPSERKQIENALLFWVEKGLNYELAEEQHLLPYKVRHIKAGVRLVQCLINCGGDISISLLRHRFTDRSNSSVQHLLLDLLVEKHMNIFTKLLIFRTLDATITTREGYLKFTASDGGENCYQRIIHFTDKDSTPTRITFAFRSLATKLNVQEGFLLLENHIDSIATEGIEDESMNEILRIYEEIHYLAQNVGQMLSHPLRILPASALVELPQLNSPGHDSKVSFIRVLEEGNYIKLSIPLLTNKQISSKVIHPIRELLECLLEWEIGLIYLCNQGEAMTEFLKLFFQNEEDDGNAIAPYVAHCLEVMKCVDKLSLRATTDEEHMEQHQALQTMHSFLNNPVGKKAVVNVLSKGNLINPVLDIFKSKYADKRTNAEKSAQYIRITKMGFAAPVLIHVVQMSESLSFLQTHGEQIHELISNFDETFEVCGKLKCVLPFLTATLNPVLMTYDGIDQLCEMLRSHKDNLFNKTKVIYENSGFPAELTTIVRILYSLGVPKTDEDVTKNLQLEENETISKELKHKLALVKMHSLDCVSLFASILNRITEEFTQPTIHGHLICGSTGDSLVSLLLPLVKLLRRIVSEVIKVRKSEFKDTSLVTVMLHTYALVSAFPRSSNSYERAQEVAVNITQTLLSYTMPNLRVGEETEEELNKSTWTAVVNDIIGFVMTAPYTFVPGLQILSEFLPLPLPIKTKEPFNEETTTSLVTKRRVWSAYLHGVSSEIQLMIGGLCDTTNSDLGKILKTVCIKLADLSSSTCLVVCRAILDPILESLEADIEQNAETTNQTPINSSINAWVETSHGCDLFQCSFQTSRRLGFLSSVMQRCPVIKSGVLHAIRGLSKVDEKYSELMSQFASIIIPRRTKPSLYHLQAQDQVITLFHSFCDIENSLLIPEVGVVFNPNEAAVVISNSLPQKDYLNTILNSLLSYINTTQGITSSNCQILEGCLRVLTVTMDTDYGFHQFKMQLEKFPGILKHLLDIIARDNLDSVQTLEIVWPCVSSFLDLVKTSILHPKQGDSHPQLPRRGSILSSNEICKCLAWSDLYESPVKSEVNGSLAIKSEQHEIVKSEDVANSKNSDFTDKDVKSEANTVNGNNAIVVAKPNPDQISIECGVHPLVILQDTLKKHSADRAAESEDCKTNHLRPSVLDFVDGALEIIQIVLNFTSKLVKSEGDIKPTVAELNVPPPEFLPELFAIRPIFVMFDKDKRIPESEAFTSILLSSVPQTFEIDTQDDSETMMIPYDLNEISRTYFPDFDVIKEVESISKLSELHKFQEPEKRVESKSKPYDDYHRRGGMNSGGGLLGLPPRKPSFNTNLRGGQMRGGFSRGLLPGPGRGGSHFDPFRSRPPNTSRPPSLHVDDFVAMESGHGSSGPNYNKPGMRSGQDNFSNRSRGNSRGGNMGRPYHDGRRGSFRQPQSGNPYYQHQQRHDGGLSRGRGRGRGYSSERWSNDNQRGGSMMGNYRQDHPRNQNNYDDKFRSGGGTTRNSNMTPNSRQQPYGRNNYREVPSGPRSGGGGGPMESSQRWKDKRSFPR